MYILQDISQNLGLQLSVARPGAAAAVAMLVARVPATNSARPPLGRAFTHRRQSAGDSGVSLLAFGTRYRRVARGQPYTVRLYL